MDSKTNEEDKQRLEEVLGRGIVEERIDKATLVPLFDPNHRHEYTADPTDQTDDFVAEACIYCPMGRLVRRA